MSPDAISLEIFRNLFSSIADEMGVSLGRTAFSPNIKERKDYSCAIFDGEGRLIAQAEHIPVHLGAMPASVKAAIDSFERFDVGDLIILNDPYMGGTHLPDVTLVSPVIAKENGTKKKTVGFVASRAHHADVGGMSPGSMPNSKDIYQEGFIIPPIKIAKKGVYNAEVFELFYRNVRTSEEREGDLQAQIACNNLGVKRFQSLFEEYGFIEIKEHINALIDYGEEMVRATLKKIPIGTYSFSDEMESSQPDQSGKTIKVSIQSKGDGSILVDFTGTSSESRDNNYNAVYGVTVSSVLYCIRCLAGPRVPANQGAFNPINIIAPAGSLVNPNPPRAVAAGNVETSQRIVDVILGALSEALPEIIPAASQGTMNNITIGGWDTLRRKPFAYYETVGGGAGAGPLGNGTSAIQTHMTNTLNTPVESLEYQFPFRVLKYAIRRGSGGTGKYYGGDGIVRSIELLEHATVSLLTQRRQKGPAGLKNGSSGSPGENIIVRSGIEEKLGSSQMIEMMPGDIVTLETPGGGGWGSS